MVNNLRNIQIKYNSFVKKKQDKFQQVAKIDKKIEEC